MFYVNQNESYFVMKIKYASLHTIKIDKIYQETHLSYIFNKGYYNYYFLQLPCN